MFGILKYRGCSQTDAERDAHRLHYCGTCKTLGTLYGQPTRFLLNHDTVFLSQLLSALAPERDQNWARAFRSFNCMSLPRAETIPLQLSIGAHLTIVLTEFKLRDQLLDSGFAGWKFARQIFSDTFDSAAAALKALSFPLESFHAHLAEQQVREATVSATMWKDDSVEKLFHYCAEPTASITGEVFRSSVLALGHERGGVGSAAQRIGEALGRLAYTIDAFDDFHRDLRRDQFNPLRALPEVQSPTFLTDQRKAIYPYVREQVGTIADELRALPIKDEQARNFQDLLIERD